MAKRILLHFSFWLAYVLALTYLNITNEVRSFDLIPEGAFALFQHQLLVQLIFLLVKIPIVYAVLLFISLYLKQKSKLAITGLSVLITLVIGAISMSLLNHQVILPYYYDVYDSDYSIFATGSLLYHALALAFIAGMAVAFKLLRWRHQTQMRLTMLEKEMMEAELKYLKGQINPHFLFNTLNNIYSLARKKSEHTAESVLKLSKLMRFMLYEANRKSIPLGDELNLIKDYIDLEKMRYTDRLTITYHESVDDYQQGIAPLILIHFVENSFKHGISESNKASFIAIDIHLQNKWLKATIINTYHEEQQNSQNPIGMENVTRQLTLLYPDHSLQVDKQNETFSIVLSVNLHQI